MADSINLGIRITADGKGAEATINNLNKTIEKVGDTSRKATSSLGSIERAATGLGSAATTASRALAGLGVAVTVRSLYNTISEFDKLNASLKTVTGSVAGATAAMGMIRDFAGSTPYDIQQVTEAFIRLRSLGLDATAASLKSYGNTAAAMGKPIMQFIEAIADATTNEFERLKEFGIKAQQEGDKVTFTFQGVSTTINKNATEIQNYLLQLGNTKFASGMVDQMNTIGGAASNLQDSFANLVDAIGNLGVRDALKKGFAGVTDFLNEVKGKVDELSGTTQESFRNSLARRIEEATARAESLKGGLMGSGLFVDKEAIAQQYREIASMEEALKRLNSELTTQTSESIGKAVEQGIQNAAPPKLEGIMQMVAESAKKYNIPEAFALAIAKTESGFRQDVTSNKGAMGVMQLMPATAERFGVDAKDTAQNIDGGMRLLKLLSTKFHGDLRLIAAAYNAGENRQSLREGRVPNIKETQDYVRKVDAAYQEFQAKYPGGSLFADSQSQQKELKDAEDRFKTHLDAMVSAAEQAAKEEASRRKTAMKQVDLDRKTAEETAKQAMASATNPQDRMAAVDSLRAAEEAAAQRAKALVDEQIASEQHLLEVKRNAINEELANADRYQLSISARAQLERELMGIQSEMRMLSDDRAMAEITAAERQLSMEAELRDMATAKRSAEQAVADEQLRLNAAFANGVQQAQLFAQQASSAFGTVGESIGKMVVGVAQFAEQLYQIERDRDTAIAKLNKSAMQGDISPEKQAEEIAKEQMKWADKSAQYQISMMGDISDATKGFFKEGSKGYKAMEMATKAFRMFEMAMAVKSMVTQIMGTEAVAAAGVKATGQAVIQSQVTGASAAPAAVAKAGEQSGWPGAIAMAAFMAAIGFGVMGAMGGGSRTVKAEDRQKTQGTGTVFGDAAAQSNSIANSLEIIRDNSSNDLNYSAAMLRSLENLSNSILALANQVTSIVMPSIDAAIQASGMQFGKTNISLFSGFNKQLTDSGIGWFEASLSRILKGDFTAKMYADITKSFEVMGMALSESTKTYVRDAGSEVSNQIILIFKDMVSALQEGASAFGKSSEQVMNALKGFKVGMEQISLKDMSMQEQTDALNAVFSKINDQMAARLNRVLDLGLGPFRKAGEGMAETFYRVSNAITTAKGAMEQMGLVAVDYKTLTAAQAQGDVAAEIAKQTVITQMTLADGVKEYITELTGSVDDIVDATKKLIEASNAMRTAGFNEGDLNRTMINAAGGLDAFNSAMESFNENFLSEADRYAGDVRNLTNQFAAFGYALPDSKEAFAAMVAGIDTSTEAGQKLFGQMIALADSFAKVADQAQQIRDKYASILDPFKAFSDRIKTVGTDFATLLGGVTGNSQGRIDAIIAEANKARVNPQKDKDMMTKAIKSNLLTVKNINDEIDGWQKKIDAEMAKKKPNRAKISKWQGNINALRDQLGGLNDAISIYQGWLDEANKRLAEIDVQEGIDKAAESARLAEEKKGIVADAVTAMGATLEQVFADIAATVQAAQQRLQSVISMQKGLAMQIAQLQGPQAVFSLSQQNYSDAMGAISTYQAGVDGGAARNIDTEVSLINAAQQAVMDRYNAEIAAIQDAEREFIAAETERLNAALQAQIEAINAATDAAIQAESDRLDAAVKAQGKADELAQKQLQKQFDLEQKQLQKAHEAQLQNLQDELDAANKLRDAIKSIADYARGMALGGNSPLSPEQRLAEAQRQYQDLLGRAQGGDADAMQKLTGASDAYLEASKAYYGSGTQYANTFDAVKNAMAAIGGMSAPDPDSIQSRIDALREAQAEEMDALRELQSEQLDLLREQQQERIDQMRKASQDVQDGIRKAAQSQIEELQKQTQQAIADLSDPNKNAAMRAARESAEAELKKLQELAELTRIEAQKQADDAKAKAEEMAKEALRIANEQLAKLDENAKISAAQLSALNSILINAGLQPIPGYAKGGTARPGLAIVGEQGPELVQFNRPGQVYNANDTKSMLGDNEKVAIAIADLKAEMKASVNVQSNAYPQMIEKLTLLEQRMSKMERNQRISA